MSVLRNRMWLAALLLGACAGHANVAPKMRAPLGLGVVRAGVGAGADLALIARPSGDRVQLALWIDAGARDAEPPQIATVAAWLAAEHAGNGVYARAWPDGTELSLVCARARAQLAACVKRLAHGLRLRAVAQAQLQSAIVKLIETRRRALAADPSQQADRLALQALYGEGGAGFFPLGQAQDDAEVTPENVRDFLQDHYGPARALLVAAGELRDDALDDAAAQAFLGLPAPTRKRAEQRPEPTAGSNVRSDVADTKALSIALAVTDLEQAHGAAASLRAHLMREAVATDMQGHVFLARGEALALLRVTSNDSQGALRAAGQELARLAQEGIAIAPVQPSGEDLEALTRRMGMRWAARDLPHGPVLGMGVGVLLPGGRADRMALADPDAALREQAQEQHERALRAGTALGHPVPIGDVNAQTASVTLDNGARIEVRQRAGEQVAIALRFAPGAAADPPLLHGRAALLASSMATACAGLTPAELSAQLTALGATLEPDVEASSWGVLLRAPGAHWEAVLALGLQCALHPALDSAELHRARLRLLQRLGRPQDERSLLAEAAAALSPAAPGALAPWGSPKRQASVSLAALREFWRTSRRADAITLAIVGPVDVQQAVDRAARRLASVPRQGAQGKAKPPGQPDSLETSPQAPPHGEQATLGLVLVRVEMAGADAAGATAYAALLRAALAQSPGIDALWHAGGVSSELAWAAVALSGAHDALASAARGLPKVTAALGTTSLQRAVDQALAQAEDARARERVLPSTQARDLVAFRSVPVRNRDAARTLSLRLAQAAPIWLPLR